MTATLVHQPGQGHACNISWEAFPFDPDPDDPLNHEQRATHYLREVHRWDAPGTVRQCDTCGRFWVAVEYPEARRGVQSLGVFWRPENRRERRRRLRALARR